MELQSPRVLPNRVGYPIEHAGLCLIYQMLEDLSYSLSSESTSKHKILARASRDELQGRDGILQHGCRTVMKSITGFNLIVPCRYPSIHLAKLVRINKAQLHILVLYEQAISMAVVTFEEPMTPREVVHHLLITTTE